MRGTTTQEDRENAARGGREGSSPAHQFAALSLALLLRRGYLRAETVAGGAHPGCREPSAQYLGADSLGYLSIEGLVRAVSLPKSIFCLACLNGEYPIEIPRNLKVSKFSLEEISEEDQLAL